MRTASNSNAGATELPLPKAPRVERFELAMPPATHSLLVDYARAHGGGDGAWALRRAVACLIESEREQAAHYRCGIQAPPRPRPRRKAN